jgi:hypothetical protein
MQRRSLALAARHDATDRSPVVDALIAAGIRRQMRRGLRELLLAQPELLAIHRRLLSQAANHKSLLVPTTLRVWRPYYGYSHRCRNDQQAPASIIAMPTMSRKSIFGARGNGERRYGRGEHGVGDGGGRETTVGLRHRSGAGAPIAKNALPKIVSASPTGLTVAAMQTAREGWRSFGRIALRRSGSLSIDKA